MEIKQEILDRVAEQIKEGFTSGHEVDFNWDVTITLID